MKAFYSVGFMNLMESKVKGRILLQINHWRNVTDTFTSGAQRMILSENKSTMQKWNSTYEQPPWQRGKKINSYLMIFKNGKEKLYSFFSNIMLDF